MKLKVCLAGGTGWVGSSLAASISAADDLELTSAISRTYAGQLLGEVLNLPIEEVPIYATAAEALEAHAADVLIDYTQPDIVKANTLTAINHGTCAVVGTSGLSVADYEEIHEAAKAKGVGVVAAGNFSITATLLQVCATTVAKHIPRWEIIEYSSAKKPDAPNGTSRELAFKLEQIRKPIVDYPLDQTQGHREARGATVSSNQIHSVRLPSFSSSNEVIFGMDGERLTITQNAGASAQPYVAGTLLATRHVKNYQGLVRGLDKVMGLA
ncbi:MAG: 4-hydroxy-tetrahydrodipicolinate reductase [Flammeovirgaceae bacterium]